MSQKFIISKPTFDATTETDPDNLIFSSDYSTLKYHASGSVSLSSTGSNNGTFVSHGLGYRPFFICYVNDPVFTTRYFMCPFTFVDVGNYAYLEAWVDTGFIYFEILTNTLSATVDFRYKIFRNRTGL